MPPPSCRLPEILNIAANASNYLARGGRAGIVTKINRKSVIVLAEDGKAQYKVSPGLLRPLRDVK